MICVFIIATIIRIIIIIYAISSIISLLIATVLHIVLLVIILWTVGSRTSIKCVAPPLAPLKTPLTPFESIGDRLCPIRLPFLASHSDKEYFYTFLRCFRRITNISSRTGCRRQTPWLRPEWILSPLLCIPKKHEKSYPKKRTEKKRKQKMLFKVTAFVKCTEITATKCPKQSKYSHQIN